MKKVELESRVKDFIWRRKLVSPGDGVVVGVSGGADSVCLLHIMARWQAELDIKLHVAHLNHQLRGVESDADAEYVIALAGRLDIPITSGKRDVAAYKAERGCSLEEAARELRYDFLAQVAVDVGAGRVAIGHTRDDQVETILMHILRGTGTSGLCGLGSCSPMPCDRAMSSRTSLTSLQTQRRDLLVVRPLLDVSRDETMSYCREHQLEPRVDSTNLSPSFLRNRLRLELLPLLRGYNPGVDEALLRLAEIAGEDDSFVEGQVLRLWSKLARQEEDTIYLDREKTIALPLALQRRLIRMALSRVLGDVRDIAANHIEAVRNLLSKPVGRRVSLPHSLVCWNEYAEVAITNAMERSHASLPLLEGGFPLRVPGETILPGWRVVASSSPAGVGFPLSQLPIMKATESSGDLRPVGDGAGRVSHLPAIAEFDFDRAGTDLFVRSRQPGDMFQPLGMDVPKKLQRFMIDARIPLLWRANIPLVCSLQQILWVVGWRISDGAKVTEATKNILRLEFIRLA